MTLYQIIKHRLVTDGYNTRYFTRDFYDLFVRAEWKVCNNIRNEINDFIDLNGVIVHEPYLPILETDFYRLNGGTYCHFLEIRNEVVKQEYARRFGK